MPNLIYKQFEPPSQIFYNADGCDVYREGTVDTTTLTPNCDGGAAVMLAGTFFAAAPSGNLLVPYPRVRVTVAASTGSPTFQVFGNLGMFQVGQTLQAKDQADATVGVIESLNFATNEITLAANAAVAVPVGENVGLDDASAGTVYGYISRDQDVASAKGTDLVTLFDGGNLWEERLPYFDSALSAAFPKISTQS